MLIICTDMRALSKFVYNIIILQIQLCQHYLLVLKLLLSLRTGQMQKNRSSDSWHMSNDVTVLASSLKYMLSTQILEGLKKLNYQSQSNYQIMTQIFIMKIYL